MRKNLATAVTTRTSVPFFIVGAQRSGTTMFRLMLNQHPELAVPFESGFITIFYRRLGEYGDLTTEENVRRLLGDIADFPLVKKGGYIEAVEAVPALTGEHQIDGAGPEQVQGLPSVGDVLEFAVFAA